MSAYKNTPETFWSLVDRTEGADACWPWMGCKAKGPRQYGIYNWRGKSMRAHRIAWMLTHDPIPDGLFALHRCDNPPCCNPAHLFLGTLEDNVHDMMAKRRHAWHTSEEYRQGQTERRARLQAFSDAQKEQPGAKLTLEQAVEIFVSSERTRAIANRMGCSKDAVLAIRKGVSWSARISKELERRKFAQ